MERIACFALGLLAVGACSTGPSTTASNGGKALSAPSCDNSEESATGKLTAEALAAFADAGSGATSVFVFMKDQLPIPDASALTDDQKLALLKQEDDEAAASQACAIAAARALGAADIGSAAFPNGFVATMTAAQATSVAARKDVDRVDGTGAVTLAAEGARVVR